MTTVVNNNGGTDGPEGESLPPYRVPQRLTDEGRHTLASALVDVAAWMTHWMEVEAHRNRRGGSEYTSRDVEEARRAYDQRFWEAEGTDNSDYRVLAVILLTIATGIGVLANYSRGTAQTVLLAVFVATEVTGLVLTWISRPRRSDRSR